VQIRVIRGKACQGVLLPLIARIYTKRAASKIRANSCNSWQNFNPMVRSPKWHGTPNLTLEPAFWANKTFGIIQLGASKQQPQKPKNQNNVLIF
jgi:hypothetical protein